MRMAAPPNTRGTLGILGTHISEGLCLSWGTLWNRYDRYDRWDLWDLWDLCFTGLGQPCPPRKLP